MYTDYFNQPVTEGDEIVYPIAGYSGRASLTRARITQIVPLVENPDKRWTLCREDQLSHSPHNRTDYGLASEVAPEKRFVAKVGVQKYSYSKRQNIEGSLTIRFVDNIIRVP